MWGRIVSSVSNALDFNQATLSGCIDIICVRNPHTGELHSTPFHVRFGKAKLLRSREKIVSVTVNDRATDLIMKLGAAGEAYFMQEVEDSVGVAEEELASPLCSPVHSPRRNRSSHTDASFPQGAPIETGALPPSHPCPGATLSTEASAVAAADNTHLQHRKGGPLFPPDSKETQQPQLPGGILGGTPERAPGSAPKAPPPSDASSTWRSAWGSAAARYEGAAAEGRDEGMGAPLMDSSRSEDARSSVQFSLCGHVLFGTADEAQHDSDVFKANLVTWEMMDENPSLWYHPSLVACFERTPPYYPAKVALPLLASWLLFNRPLSLNSVKRLMTAEINYADREGPAWAPWQAEANGSASGALRPRPGPLADIPQSNITPGREQHLQSEMKMV